MIVVLRFFLIQIILFSAIKIQAQEYSISGKVIDHKGIIISFANVAVKTSDSTTIKGTSSDENGSFIISGLAPKNYILQFSFIGYKEVSLPINLNGNLNLKSIVLEEDVESLNEVTITAKRPTVKREAGRLTFNIENTALSEGSMLQALRSTPGVLVVNGGLSVKGDSPTVYINNKRVQISADELTQLLESSSANSVKSIEVITNPSAKYDADSGVVLNITMSKNLVIGYRSNVLANYTQGVFPRYNFGTSHFIKNKTISFSANYNYTKNKINRFSDQIINYLEPTTETLDEQWTSKIGRNTWSETHNLNLNFDWFIDDNNTLSLSSNSLYLPYFKYLIKNRTVITDNLGQFQSRFDANNLSRDDKYNLGFDLNFNHRFKSGSSLTFNGHFTTYDYERDQNVTSDFYDSNNNFDQASAFNTNANQATTIFTSKLDYNLPINENSNLEAGIKFANVLTESDINRFNIDVNTGDSILDQQNTDAFDYDEKVYAAYTNYSLETDKWDLSLGLRAEQTNVEGISISTNQTNAQDYLELFPNASVQYTISDNVNVYANYRRSISRPNYTALNPFTFFLNENTTVTGNPNLVPTFLDHYTIGTHFLDMFTVEAYYQNYDGKIVELPQQNNVTNDLVYTSINLDKTVDFGFDFAVELYPTERWSLYAVTSFYNLSEETKIGADFTTIERWSNYSELSSNISFLKDKSLNFYAELTWVGKNAQALQTVNDRLFSSFALSKSILKKKGVISLSIEDLFNYQDDFSKARYLNQFSSNAVDSDNRFIKLGFRYKFGNTRLESNERNIKREERDRLQASDKN